jgi:Ca2+-binding RTX toxin-like protein
MRKRIFVLMALALMLVAAMALSGVAQAASPRAKCKQEAASLGLSLDGYNFIYGNNKNNDLSSQATAGPDFFCGLGGNYRVLTLDAGDIFVGGAGDDDVYSNGGTFNGGDGNDSVYYLSSGATFIGGAGNDSVTTALGGTFYGDADNDSVHNNDATFYGGDGIDTVDNGNPPVDGP